MNARDKELAKQAGMVYREFEDEFANANTDGVDQKTMQQFADLIRADEREACAKVAQETICDTHIPTGINIYGTRAAKAIQARGNT
jgi:hypothetical protein